MHFRPLNVWFCTPLISSTDILIKPSRPTGQREYLRIQRGGKMWSADVRTVLTFVRFCITVKSTINVWPQSMRLSVMEWQKWHSTNRLSNGNPLSANNEIKSNGNLRRNRFPLSWFETIIIEACPTSFMLYDRWLRNEYV